MTRPPKLTPPQIELLTHAIAAGRATCAEEYPPRKKLISLGYVSEKQGKYSSWIEPTESGVAALRALPT